MKTKTVYIVTQLIFLLAMVVNAGVYIKDGLIFNLVVGIAFVAIMITWHMTEGKKYLKGK